MNLRSDQKVIIQGITETMGQYYSSQMQAYGTNIVAGVSTIHGQKSEHGIPIFNLVEQAVEVVGQIDTSIIFSHPYQVKDAALEAIAAGIKQIIIVTRGIPPLDMVSLSRKAKATNTLILGPGSAGIIIPEQILLGTSEPHFYTPGKVAILSRSHCLSHEIALGLGKVGMGQSVAINLGNEEMITSSFEQWLYQLEHNSTTQAIVLVGQSHGNKEELAAKYISAAIRKPVVAYVAGNQLPVITNHCNQGDLAISCQPLGFIPQMETVQPKIAAFEEANIPVAKSSCQIPALVKQVLQKQKSEHYYLNGKDTVAENMLN